MAIIPFHAKDRRRLYVVLKPIDKLDGVASDEAIVFLVDDSIKGNNILKVETDEEVAIGVFIEYYKLLDEVSCSHSAANELVQFFKLLNKKRKGDKI